MPGQNMVQCSVCGKEAQMYISENNFMPFIPWWYYQEAIAPEKNRFYCPKCIAWHLNEFYCQDNIKPFSSVEMPEPPRYYCEKKPADEHGVDTWMIVDNNRNKTKTDRYIAETDTEANAKILVDALNKSEKE